MASITKLIEKEVEIKGLKKHFSTIRYQVSDMLVRAVWDSDELENALNKQKELNWKITIDKVDTLCTIRLDYIIDGVKEVATTNFYLHDLI